MLHHRGCNLGLASRSGSDLELERVVSVLATSATSTRPPNASAASTSSSRTRAWRLKRPFLDLSREHPDEMLDVNLEGHGLRHADGTAAHARVRGRRGH